MSKSRIRIPLGDLDPCGSRQAGRRSGLTVTYDGPIAGLADGSVRAFDFAGEARWHVDGEGSAISLAPFDDGVLVGERSARGAIRFISDGEEEWRHEAADVLGGATKDTRFFLPMVVDVAVDGDTAYVAARRYERRDDERHFESAVYALRSDGTVRWRYDADASPISVAPFKQGVAIAYNRCPGSHDDGLVVLDGEGKERWTWNPAAGAQRRVGDVSAADGSLFVTSHADYRGYRISEGRSEWSVDLGRPLPDGDEVYTYPNHVHASESGVAFLTGNSFPKEGRETDERHPNEQSVFGHALDGDRKWTAETGGFSHEVATDDDRLLVPVAQHFRDRDPSVHGWHLFDVDAGRIDAADSNGIVTAAGLRGERLALIEEPVRYHDDGEIRGEYALYLP